MGQQTLTTLAGMPRVDIVEWDELLDSSNIEPDDWVTIANQIKERYYDYDGFVVLHGTDTMAYTASALSFLLQNLGKPVVFTGAMTPLGYPHNDATRNVFVSIITAGVSEIP